MSRATTILDAKPYTNTLQALEDNAAFTSSRYAGYALGVLATEYAVQSKGLRAVAAYYRAVGGGTKWQDAFTRASD